MRPRGLGDLKELIDFRAPPRLCHWIRPISGCRFGGNYRLFYHHFDFIRPLDAMGLS